MNSSTINTLFGASANPSGSNKVSPSTSVLPFGDVLTREMNERQNPSVQNQTSVFEGAKTAAPSQAQNTNSAQSSSPVQQPGKPQSQEPNSSKATSGANDSKPDGSNTAASPAESTDIKSVAPTKPEKAKKRAEDGDKADDNMKGTGVTSASAELMALVNSLVQKPAVDASASADTKTVNARAVSGKGSAALLKEVGDTKADDRAAADLLAKMKGLVPKQTAVSETTIDTVVTKALPKDPTTAIDPTALTGKKIAHETSSLTSINSAIDTPVGRGKDMAAGRVELTVADFRKVVETDVHIRQTDKQVELTPIGNFATAGSALATSGINARQAAGIPTDILTPRVGTTAWDNALGQKVVWMAAGAQQSATITLNPPDLGPLQVVINVSNAQADAAFTSAQPEVRQALEAALPRLKEMLGDAGISLGQVSVNAGSPNQQGTASQDQSQSGTRSSQLNLSNGEHDKEVTPITQSRNRATSGGDGMVDTFA